MAAIASLISQHGCLAIFAFLMLGIVGLPVPDEMLLTFVGYLIFLHDLPALPAAAAALFGSISGITVSYGLGRTCGLPLMEKYGRLIHLKREHFDKVQRWFHRIGKWALTVGYFIPGARHFTGFAAGTSKLRWPVFAVHAYLGALLWAAAFISLGYFLGGQWPLLSAHLLEISPKIHLVLLGGILLATCTGAGYFLVRRSLARLP
jgi:membrane protein DedA with SNARE-associated domain